MSNLKLFDDADLEQAPTTVSRIEAANREGQQALRGLSYLPCYITTYEEAELLRRIDAEPWSNELERRVQHYGYKYDYKSRRIDDSMRVGDLPPWLLELANRLCTKELFTTLPDQVIVNEYLPGQGIFTHIDCEPCFGETIASLTLGSGCVMDFAHRSTGERIPMYLESRSLVVLREDARYVWRHAIAKRQTDHFAGEIFRRSRRVSLTFRTIRHEGPVRQTRSAPSNWR